MATNVTTKISTAEVIDAPASVDFVDLSRAVDALAAAHHGTRSAWGRGVVQYAKDLADDLETRAKEAHFAGEPAPKIPEHAREFYILLLNGAQDFRKPEDLFAAWSVYSWGGSSLIYNGDIAARLCTPSELRKTRNGERRPNAREEWLDVQARALYQAARVLWNACKEYHLTGKIIDAGFSA